MWLCLRVSPYVCVTLFSTYLIKNLSDQCPAFIFKQLNMLSIPSISPEFLNAVRTRSTTASFGFCRRQTFPRKTNGIDSYL